MKSFGTRLMGYAQSMILLTSSAVFAVTNTVQVGSDFFSPMRLTNHVGDTIRFVLQSGSHTVTGEPPEAFCGSGAMPASCQVTLNNAGTFRYRCLFHSSSFTSGMVGTVTVLPAASTPPNVVITNPSSGAVFTAPASLTLGASASDSDGVSRVEFFQDGTLIGTDTNPPYSQAVSGLTPKTYTFSAVATDTLGAKATNSITLTVQSPPSPPTVAILSPTNGTVFVAPATVMIEASASATVTNVSFVLSSSTASNSFAPGVCSPGSIPEHICLTLTNLSADTYQASAIATDDLGAKVTNSIAIVVYAQPLLSSPVRGPGGKFRFDITSKAGQPIVIQSSENLTAWQNLRTTNAPTDKFTYMDESTTNISVRFYRTRTP
jgi:plastocyanin